MTQPTPSAPSIPVPQISEEPLASVLRVLALTPLGGDRFRAPSLPQLNRIYGGQVLAQALLAAAATINDCATLSEHYRLPHSFHAYFVRGGDPMRTLDFEVQRTHDGRSFASRTVHAQQGGQDMMTLMASFQVRQHGISHCGVGAPDVPSPDELRSALELFRSLREHPVGRFLGKTAAFDVRHVQEPIYVSGGRLETSTQQLWMRPRAAIPSTGDSNVDQTVARALLAYVVDQVMLEPALRAHGLAWMTPGMAIASLDHAMWFHHDVTINDWLLYDQCSPTAQGARALGEVRVFTRDGQLVASATQEAMIRLPNAGEEHGSSWTFHE